MTLLIDAPVSTDTPSFDVDGNAIHIFTPPILFDMGPINPDTIGNERRLFGYYQPHGRYATVWKLPDGSYTLETPYPLVTPDDARMGILPQGQATEVTYVHVYQVPERVSDAEAAALVAAGYAVT